MGCDQGEFITAPSGTCPTFKLPENIELERGARYWWAVWARDEHGNWSEASEWWSFATINNDNDGDGIPDNLDEDDDNDGMPDAWEETYGLDPLFDDSGADFDGDTFSNLQEFQAGSDPTEPPEYGTTIITHGFILDFGDHDGTLQEESPWTITMAVAIGERAGRATIYLFKDGRLYKKGYIGGGAGPNGMQGENILMFDWIAESDRPIEGYAEAAGDSLFANLMEGAIKGEWSLEHLHFIGHSRGCVVNSECIQRLLYMAGSNSLPSGILVDNNIHMTTLDPHPWDDYDTGPDSNDNAVNGNIGCGVVGWKADSGSEEFRTGYIDNYYQHNHRIHIYPLSHPTGLESYSGAWYNVNLSCMESNVTEYFKLATGYSGKWMNHSGVHAWYHGTIKHDAENDGDGLDIGIYRQNWYEEPLCNGELPFGYNKSRIGDGDLEIYSALLDQLRDVTDDNTFVDPVYNVPNLIFNGDFSKHDISGELCRPGWELQGGGGNGNIDRGYLELNQLDTSIRHNKFYIPENVNALEFKYKVTNIDRDGDDRLEICLSSESGDDEGYILRTVDLDQATEDWQDLNLNIKPWLGTVRTLTFKIANYDWSVNSEVHIDNVSLQADADLDGLPDVIEREWMACLDLNNNDSDGDGLLDGIEDANHNGIFDFDQGETNPCDADTDNDGLVDGNTGSEDLNANGIVDPGETDPANPDTDGDGIFDGTERGLTEPETADTDVSAGFFVVDTDPSTTTDPTDADSDDDGILDGNEDKNHDGLVNPSAGETDPGNPDSDGDGIYDGTEIGLTEPQNAEATDLSQEHFISDADPATITDPTNPDSDGDGVSDGEEDVNGDGSFSPELGETDPNSAAGVQGDLDGDSDVDYDDYLIFRTAYGSCSGDENFLPGADLDSDGCVTINDYRILRILM